MFGNIFSSLWNNIPWSSVIPAGISMLGGLLSKGTPQRTTSQFIQAPQQRQEQRTETRTEAESPMRTALMNRALENLPQDLTAADIAQERAAASTRGRDFSAARGFQAPGAPFVGMPQTISDEAAMMAGIDAQRFNRAQQASRANIIAGLGPLTPAGAQTQTGVSTGTTGPGASTTTTTALQRPNMFEAMTGVGKSLGSIFDQDQKKRPGAPQYGAAAPLRTFDDLAGPYNWLGGSFE